ncbi:MAG: GNAT family N-acetyltransferase [Methylobacter sp.]|nr:GNAT family N-acetyltransferase [Methylobacter sp.]MDP2097062.1 GNAT family N-acetyltransferase [Methylobacter sp.]MDP2428000.1 GNAT family N-acetyltransferase [Methylobacter sp.]MDP3055896.1 GNAT family N-acetyltransferase [Methylobacter sp.]MDP3363054.1 GNAT family N-acetyltransferase [Methylobacter sp.]
MIYQLSKDYFVRHLAEADLDGVYPSWFEDQDVTRYSSHGKLFKTKAYFNSYVEALNREDRVVWAICHVNDGHIGNISLQAISWIDRTAEFAILLGDKRHWAKGVGLLAGKKILGHGFNKLNLERIYCGTAATNDAMKKLAQTMGMVLEGTQRQHFFLEGSRVDLLEYGILRAEFERGVGL